MICTASSTCTWEGGSSRQLVRPLPLEAVPLPTRPLSDTELWTLRGLLTVTIPSHYGETSAQLPIVLIVTEALLLALKTTIP